jgi:hypothetical protein
VSGGRLGIGGRQRDASGPQPERGRCRDLAALLEVLGDHRRRLLSPGEESRHQQAADASVGLVAGARWQAAIDHLAEQAAGEAQFPLGRFRRSGVAALDQAIVDQFLERLADIALAAGDDLFEETGAHRLTQHRGVAHRGPRRRAQPIDASGDHVVGGAG